MSLWMTFSFLKFRLLKRIVNKQKNTVGLYWAVYFRKTKGIFKNIGKKKKRKILKLAFSGRLNQITQKSLSRNFYWPFLPNKEQNINFYSIQGLDFQYQKENDQECTARNPALKSLRVDEMRREWEIAKRAKVTFLVTEPQR